MTEARNWKLLCTIRRTMYERLRISLVHLLPPEVQGVGANQAAYRSRFETG